MRSATPPPLVTHDASPDAAIRRGTGAPGHQGTGTPGHRDTGAPGDRGSGLPGHWDTGVPPSVPVPRCPGTPVSWCPGVAVSQCPGAPVSRYPRCPGVPVSRCPGAPCPNVPVPPKPTPGGSLSGTKPGKLPPRSGLTICGKLRHFATVNPKLGVDRAGGEVRTTESWGGPVGGFARAQKGPWEDLLGPRKARGRIC